MDNNFTPIEVSSHTLVYHNCIGKSVYYFNIVGSWALVLLVLWNFVFNYDSSSLLGIFAIPIAYFIVGPSGTRRIYNKTNGSRTASNIACLLCVWFNVVGWLICWFYENW